MTDKYEIVERLEARPGYTPEDCKLDEELASVIVALAEALEPFATKMDSLEAGTYNTAKSWPDNTPLETKITVGDLRRARSALSLASRGSIMPAKLDTYATSTAAASRSREDETRAATIEECAKVADDWINLCTKLATSDNGDVDGHLADASMARNIASDIRSLSGQPAAASEGAVAWRYKYRDCLGWTYQDNLCPAETEHVRDIQPLYTHPPAVEEPS